MSSWDMRTLREYGEGLPEGYLRDILAAWAMESDIDRKGLYKRAMNALWNAKIDTLEKFKQAFDNRSLSRVKNLGPKSIAIVVELFKEQDDDLKESAMGYMIRRKQDLRARIRETQRLVDQYKTELAELGGSDANQV